MILPIFHCSFCNWNLSLKTDLLNFSGFCFKKTKNSAFNTVSHHFLLCVVFSFISGHFSICTDDCFNVFFLCICMLHLKLMTAVYLAGCCCRLSEKPCPHGVHFRRITAITNLGVLGRMEHGELGRGGALSNPRVS